MKNLYIIYTLLGTFAYKKWKRSLSSKDERDDYRWLDNNGMLICNDILNVLSDRECRKARVYVFGGYEQD
jgi:hypothetical protein